MPHSPLRGLLGPWLVTFLAHAALLVLALAWVVVRHRPAPQAEADCFTLPCAGGSASPGISMRRERPSAVPAVRITSRAAGAAIALPVGLPLPPGVGRLDVDAGGRMAGGPGGRGLGPAGHGLGATGVGAGLIGKPVLGARIAARRVAVYLDCSGSMRPYLAQVEAEIRRQFPDADVFRFDGARVVVVDGEVAEGRGFDGRFGTSHPGQSEPATMTPGGRRLLERISRRCEAGSLGAWIDWLLAEDYDGLVVFSDFQDGVRQYRQPRSGPPELIYADGKRRQVDTRREADARWERAWLGRFAAAPGGRGPRLYLFSIEVEPQPILSQCAVASGGGVTMVGWLRGRAPR